jgi:tetratricopeptide (TPR) repeat protein
MLWQLALTVLLASSDERAALKAALEREARGDSAGALADCEALVRRAPAWELPRLEAARLLLERGDGLARAEWHAEAARSIAPENPRAQYLAGLVLEEKGELRQAAYALESAVLLREDFDEARFRLAGLLLAKEPERAAQQYAVLVRHDPQLPGVRLQLAQALEASGALGPAEAALKEAARLPRGQETAARRLIAFYERAGRKAEAARWRKTLEAPKRSLRELKPSAR